MRNDKRVRVIVSSISSFDLAFIRTFDNFVGRHRMHLFASLIAAAPHWRLETNQQLLFSRSFRVDFAGRVWWQVSTHSVDALFTSTSISLYVVYFKHISPFCQGAIFLRNAFPFSAFFSLASFPRRAHLCARAGAINKTRGRAGKAEVKNEKQRGKKRRRNRYARAAAPAGWLCVPHDRKPEEGNFSIYLLHFSICNS